MPHRSTLSCFETSLVLLFLFERFVVFVQVAVNPRKFQGFYANDFILGSTFFAGDNVAFFYFIELNV